MSITLKSATFGLLLLALAPTFISCGGSTNNDQGTSFTATGFYTDVLKTTGIMGANVVLSSDVSGTGGLVSNVLTEDGTAIAVDGRQLFIYMALSNRLSKQFVRVVRIDCSYDIQGATIAVPDDSVSTSVVIEAGASTTVDNVTTVTPSEGVVGFAILTPDLFSFLNNNSNSLPVLPYSATAICSAVAVTQAGDTITSNPLYFAIEFFDSADCCTGTGTGGGGGYQTTSGTGGTITTTGTSTATDSGTESATSDSNTVEESTDSTESSESTASSTAVTSPTVI